QRRSFAERAFSATRRRDQSLLRLRRMRVAGKEGAGFFFIMAKLILHQGRGAQSGASPPRRRIAAASGFSGKGGFVDRVRGGQYHRRKALTGIWEAQRCGSSSRKSS